VRIGIRDAVSAVFGGYADQRLMQAGTDAVKTQNELAERYDNSDVTRWRGPTGPDWGGYIPEGGAGFGPAFGMGRGLGEKELKVGSEMLPAGEILLLGGDQCYPQATHEEYEERFVLPYAAALPPVKADENPPKGNDKLIKGERKLFALPGNHDWYDGLG